MKQIIEELSTANSNYSLYLFLELIVLRVNIKIDHKPHRKNYLVHAFCLIFQEQI